MKVILEFCNDTKRSLLGSYTPLLVVINSPQECAVKKKKKRVCSHTIAVLCQTTVVTALTRICTRLAVFWCPLPWRLHLGALSSVLEGYSEWNCVCPTVLAVSGILQKALWCCAHRACMQVSSQLLPQVLSEAVLCPQASSLFICQPWPPVTGTSLPCDWVARWPLSEDAGGPDLVPLTTILPCFQHPSDTICSPQLLLCPYERCSLSPYSYTKREALL